MRAWREASRAAALVLAAGAAAAAAPPALDGEQALRVSGEAVGRLVGEHLLTDQEGRPVRLSDYRGKPLVVSFLYTGCFQVCPTTTRTLQSAVTAAQASLGERSFNVVSIGFNPPADAPATMKSYAAQHGIGNPGWSFLSGTREAIEAATRDFGFSFVATPAGFDHVLQVSLVDADGRVARQIYGDEWGPDMLGDPLKRLVAGAPLAPGLAGWVERVRILCTVWDPATGRYRVSYAIIVELVGGISFLVAVGAWLVRERLRARSA